MKRLRWPVILIPFLIIGLVFPVSCAELEPTEQPDVPRYTADQVIAVAQAYSPSIPPLLGITQVSYSAQYLEQGVWIVKKFALDKYGINLGELESWYFHEKDGQLNKSRY